MPLAQPSSRLSSASRIGGASPSVGRIPGNAQPGIFAKVLQQALQRAGPESLNVSQHAEKRLQERRIPFGPETKAQLAKCIEELRSKGARDSLVITKDAAFVVNVPSRTLVTAMDLGEMQYRIITKIDSVSVKNG
ncbi:hypothetical protein AUK22_05730 [bacterium CG2_30_54_10]|nr:MAG: hypothetical protein AUK22_05730 [bacterium CG2_30_54_10]